MAFLTSDEHKKKYRLTKWEVVCTPKDQGGLGVLILDVHNKCLLSKWLFRLLNGDGVWQQLLRNKYLKDKTNTGSIHAQGLLVLGWPHEGQGVPLVGQV